MSLLKRAAAAWRTYFADKSPNNSDRIAVDVLQTLEDNPGANLYNAQYSQKLVEFFLANGVTPINKRVTAVAQYANFAPPAFNENLMYVGVVHVDKYGAGGDGSYTVKLKYANDVAATVTQLKQTAPDLYTGPHLFTHVDVTGDVGVTIYGWKFTLEDNPA